MARLLITDGVQEGRAYRLRAGVNRVGRSIDNHFQIVDASVSSSHCEITFSEDEILVRDLNSTNGTWINGDQIAQAVLRPGQVLQVGNITLALEERFAPESGPTITIPEIERAASARLVLADGSQACANHPELRANYRCSKCGQTLCDSCVRVIHRMAGETLAFCTLCSGPCEEVSPVAPPVALAGPKKAGFFGRLSQTLRLPFKERRS